MRLRTPAQQWALGILVILFALGTSAISTRRTKAKSNGHVDFKNEDNETSPQKISERQGLDSELGLEHYDDSTALEASELVKKTQNVNETNKPEKSNKEESPPNLDVIHSTDLSKEEGNNDNGEHLAKADYNRASRKNKNPRIYYDDATPRFPDGEGPDFENSVRQGKQKDGGKFYFPKNYLGSKNGPKKGHKPSPSIVGISGKRVPDHVSFDEEGHTGHDYPVGHDLGEGIGHEEHHELSHGITDEAPYPHHHEVEEHHGKSHGHHHVSGYGYHHHYGSYRHTIGDKVDAVGKALQVLIPSALLITGVSALFPNRVHVPTTPNKYRQKRSAHYFRRRGYRAMEPPPEPMIHPEFDDIPSHILEAEHRIMDTNPEEMYPDWGKRQGEVENAGGFDPFKVFKGPGPETTMRKIHDSIPLPEFPTMPDMPVLATRTQYLENHGDGGQGAQPNYYEDPNLNLHTPSAPPSTYGPVDDLPDVIPPTMMGPEMPTTPIDLGAPPPSSIEMSERARPSAIIRRRKMTTKKPSAFQVESSNHRSTENQRSSVMIKPVKNAIDDVKFHNPVKAEEEFMASLQNLVTPDIAKALINNNKQEAPKKNNFDLSPDGPVMGLLTSYAQHEKDSPICQKRALCELAVKGKGPKSSKFESFLWSVATLVPDVFSEMYDLQEVFHAIRDERCGKFDCPHPNLDLQMK